MKINKITNGIALKTLIKISIILNITVFCFIPSFLVIVKTTPKNKPKTKEIIPGIKNNDQVSIKL